MAKFNTDIIEYLFDQSQISFNSIDTPALDALIQEYLETTDNGYAQVEVTEYEDDATAYITYLVDSTSPTITVEEWKIANLEQMYNQSLTQNGQIGITDHNSPNYPLIDFRGALFDFDTTSSIDYEITPDSTGDIFIEYELPTARKVDGMYIQPGINGLDSTTDIVIFLFYIGFSNDGESWTYIAGDALSPTIYTDQQDAINYPLSYLWFRDQITSNNVAFVNFPETSIEAKYWRTYFVPETGILPVAYTASISHLTFDQIKEHGELLFDNTVEKAKTTGVFATGDVAAVYSTSGAGWFTSATFVVTAIGVREQACKVDGRFYADGSAEIRLQFQNDPGSAWVTVDGWEFLAEGQVSIHDAREAVNPNTDVADSWVFKYRIQDRAAVGTPTIEYRFGLMTTFRSSQVT